MAYDTLALLDKCLDYMIEPLVDAVVAHDDRPLQKLFQRADSKKVFGRGLKAYFPIVTDHSGAYGVMSEAGEFPAGKAGASTEASLSVIKQALTFSITDEALQAMKGGRDAMKTSIDEIILGGMRTHKAREEYMLFGRGDGAVARNVTERATSVTTFTSSVPIRAVEGDQIIWFARRKASGAIAATAAYVTGVDHENLQFDVSTSPTVTIKANYVAYLKGTSTAGTIGTDYPYGLEAMLNRTSATYIKWDAADSATKRTVETYAGLARSTNSKMNVQKYDAGTTADVSLTNLMIGPSMCFAKGVKPGDMVLLMHEKMVRRIMTLLSGALKLENQDVKLPLGNHKLPVLMHGQYSLPIISSYYFPDGLIACVDKTDFLRLDIQPEWVQSGGGSKWHQAWAYSNAVNYDYKLAYFRWYGNFMAKRPFRHAVTVDLSVS